MRMLIVFFLSFMMILGADEKEDVLPQGQVHNGDYFVSGGNIQISGVVKGDVYAIGSKVNIDGQIEGDVIASGGTIEISGEVLGNARLAGGQIVLSGVIGHNCTAIGGTLQMSPGALIKGNGVFTGGEVDLAGHIQGDVTLNASNAVLEGKIDNDLKARVGQLQLLPDTEIGGNLDYTSGQKVIIDEGAKIGGQVVYHPSAVREFLGVKWKEKLIVGSKLLGISMNLFFSFVIGMIYIKMFPNGFKNALKVLKTRPWKAVGMGLLTLILLPLICLILLVTILGFPIALALIAFSLLTFYTAKIIPIMWISNAIFPKHGLKQNSLWALFLGLILFFIVLQIPFLGGLISLSFILLGLGAAFLGRTSKKKLNA